MIKNLIEDFKEFIEEKINKECTSLEYNSSDKNYKDIMIENHRRLWRWLTYQSLIKKRKVYKAEYFNFYNIKTNVYNNCYLCEYSINQNTEKESCSFCPIKWKHCTNPRSLYHKWVSCLNSNYKKASYYAWRISKLKKKRDIKSKE